ncbi:C2 and GRAM domain-containing protein [Striga hermonthica]|uniref:C2 and GRAM domain-containing protein n=1 Tax=Striga hermonthica TaxID=68872 RepID=A0A9N7RCN1_STRHE|nr:C2 and GRAM domain-containing protein [Striga hermonthica]
MEYELRNFYATNVGKLLLALSLHGKDHNPAEASHSLYSEGKIGPSHDTQVHAPDSTSKKTLDGKHLIKALAGRLEKFLYKKDKTSRNESPSELSTPSDYEDCKMELPSSSNFQELMELLQSKNENVHMPDNLQGGILIDQTYEVSPKDLNMVIFAPDSEFKMNLADFVSTADVPYGNTFKVQLLYKIMPGVMLSSENQLARLVVSFSVNFSQSTMMKGVIESGVKQGLKESFDQSQPCCLKSSKLSKLVRTKNRTIMGLWRTTIEADHKAEFADEQVDDDEKPFLIDDTGSYLVVDDAKLTNVI